MYYQKLKKKGSGLMFSDFDTSKYTYTEKYSRDGKRVIRIICPEPFDEYEEESNYKGTENEDVLL